ncbi:Mitochondrial fission factor [Sciurus carolinensis]|uniref:Mitochondrial fission factor n=1 Tax=Sciurus carolinensis TaxID=30640 RepID=A0AA41MCT1_SCICA|nr:Mitochondrial fission factor [Sciurus carolinensis]
MAEISQIQYKMENTKVISQQMRVLGKLKVTLSKADLEQEFQGVPNTSVPENVVMAGNLEDIPFSRPADPDLIQSTTFKPLALIVRNHSTATPSAQQAPICPVQMQPEDTANLGSAPGIFSLIQSSSHRTYNHIFDVLDQSCRPMLGGGSPAATSNPPYVNIRNDISNIDTVIEGTPDDMTTVDAVSLRRQIIKLNRRLQLLEEENKERAKREMVMYSITVAFWLLNSWLWFRR